MRNLMQDLPLQEMLSRVLGNAHEKLAEDVKSKDRVKKLVAYEKGEHGGRVPTVKEEQDEKSILGDPSYHEKLASALDLISDNVRDIVGAPQGVLAGAVEKLAGAPSVLPVARATSGKQLYKKDKPGGEDPAASQASTPLSRGGGHSATQLDNNMHQAPGQSSGAVPHAEYPEKGPLVSLNKHASVRDIYQWAIEKKANMAPLAPQGALPSLGSPQGPQGALPGSSPAHKPPGHAGHPGSGGHMPKTASDLAREHILMKLAGEDVMKANISAPRSGGPKIGDGVLSAHEAESVPRQPGDATGSSAFGNANRKHVASNRAAMDMTKREAKKDMVPQLGQVLDHPAFSPSHDSKLNENLRNTGKAGVKIAAARTLLEKLASGGCTCDGRKECSYCLIKVAADNKAASTSQSNKSGKTKTANMGGFDGGGGLGAGGGGGGGGGMAPTATAGVSPDGCSCDHTGACRVCKLKAALAEAQAEATGGGGGAGGVPGAEQQVPQGVPGAI